MEKEFSVLHAPSGKKSFINLVNVLGNCNSVDIYEKICRIGEGTYGVVYKARHKESQEIVALKKIRVDPEHSASNKNDQKENDDYVPPDGLPLAHFREIMLLKKLHHPNIVQVKEVVVGRQLASIFSVMEYCVNDLAALIDSMAKPFIPGEIKCLFWQLLKGIEYLHQHFVIHRDLKLSNLLLTSDGTLKIADFGLARKFDAISADDLRPSRPMTPKVVTLWYRAPEILFGDPNYSIPVDMWSVGCIFGELMQHAPLLAGSSELQQLTLISELIGSPSNKIWPGFDRLPLSNSFKLPEIHNSSLRKVFPNFTQNTVDLLGSLLTYDPSMRYTVQQALEHPYFNEQPRRIDKQFMRTFPDQRDPSKRQIQEQQLQQLKEDGKDSKRQKVF